VPKALQACETLLAYRRLWASELDCERCLTDQPHLTRPEAELLRLLISNDLGINVRFEQEWTLNPALLRQALDKRQLQ